LAVRYLEIYTERMY